MRVLAAVLGALVLLAQPARAETFSFVALGDTAYNPAVDYPVYEALIQKINKTRPAFSIHVGDTWGALPCTEEQHRSILGWFAKYDHPVVYTPGDNEWADCRKPEVLEAYSRYVGGKATPADLALLLPLRGLDAGMTSAGYDDPLGSLALIRKVFFDKPQSVGGKTMPLVRQPNVSAFKDTAENTRWEKGGVVFATLSAPGSSNGFLMQNEARAAEAIARNRANVDWIKSTFAEAKAKDAKAVVISLQAAMFVEGDGGEFSGKELRGGFEGPYYWLALAIRDLGGRFGKPVLLINGDFHDFIVDRPFMVSQGEVKPPLYANITRLQVYGAPELKAVKIGVDTETPWVFSFEPLY
ncbi:MAG: hypothetical protein Q8Q88_01480 [Phenylobacterium sp.]|uniref:hypothetical protein n=1 Tax=Phenylobacterium sp. TaxID=1871053 RepID=UPI0027375CF0|nr:hypothetical protein [Phenylobacterium sp.]MDP3745697.1 hypothetical protein [Phenylobacterium sp.]